MFIKYFNKTHSIEAGDYPYYLAVFYAQVVLIFIVLSYYVLNIYIDIRTHQFGTNTQKIHHAIYLPCVLGHVLCLVQKILLIVDSPAGHDVNNDLFYTISLIRAVLCFPGFYCLSAFVAERWFATYYLDDYEKVQRTWLVFIILWAVYAFAFVSALDFHHASSTIPHVCVFISVSCLAYLGNYTNFLVNRSFYYRSMRTDGGGYSLAQRFQISENIRFSLFFQRLALSISFFQISGPLCILFGNLAVSESWKNLNTVVFDTICLMYAIVTPYVIYYHNPKYNHELAKLMSKLRLRRFSGNQVKPTIKFDSSSTRIQDTFGNQLVFDTNQNTSTYFSELDRSWK